MKAKITAATVLLGFSFVATLLPADCLRYPEKANDRERREWLDSRKTVDFVTVADFSQCATPELVTMKAALQTEMKKLGDLWNSLPDAQKNDQNRTAMFAGIGGLRSSLLALEPVLALRKSANAPNAKNENVVEIPQKYKFGIPLAALLVKKDNVGLGEDDFKKIYKALEELSFVSDADRKSGFQLPRVRIERLKEIDTLLRDMRKSSQNESLDRILSDAIGSLESLLSDLKKSERSSP